jgi:octaprenyl-diphosphate synthase
VSEDLKQWLLSRVQDDLEEIERALLENLQPQLEVVSAVAGHILFSGGKRLRPLLMVLSARACGYRGDYDKTFSTIFEYLHVATLLHDDLVDDASLRRGKLVAHTLWDNSTAVLVGDFLLARALSIAARTRLPRVISVIAEITENMSQGEIHQLQRKGDLGLSESEYLEVIRRKTAVLFQGACRVSALIAHADSAREEALADYGYQLGMAFQIADDLLDYTQDTTTLGKAPGADLREGKLTLPVIHALKEASAADRTLMESIIRNPEFTLEEFRELVGLLEKYGGLAYARSMAHERVDAAKSALSIFAASETRDILLGLADYSLSREM